nr:hypothetical protein [Cupriavidus gilardii]
MIPLRSQQRIAMSQAVRVVILNRSRIVMKWDGRQWWNVEVSPSDEPSGIKPAAVA